MQTNQRRRRIAATHAHALGGILASTLIGACGGSPVAPTPIVRADAGPTVPTGATLQWDQAAPSPDTLPAYQFTLYVDDAANVLRDVRCKTSAGPIGYECSGTLPAIAPGRHTLTLTATFRGLESPHSFPLIASFETTDALSEEHVVEVSN